MKTLAVLIKEENTKFFERIKSLAHNTHVKKINSLEDLSQMEVDAVLADPKYKPKKVSNTQSNAIKWIALMQESSPSPFQVLRNGYADYIYVEDKDTDIIATFELQ